MAEPLGMQEAGPSKQRCSGKFCFLLYYVFDQMWALGGSLFFELEFLTLPPPYFVGLCKKLIY